MSKPGVGDKIPDWNSLIAAGWTVIFCSYENGIFIIIKDLGTSQASHYIRQNDESREREKEKES